TSQAEATHIYTVEHLHYSTSTPVLIHSDPDPLVGSSESQCSKYEMRRSRRYYPYPFRSRPPPLELEFTMKSVGRNHHTDIGLLDVIRGRDIFLKGLSSLSDDTITLVASAKHAARENIRLKIIQLGWEIQEAEYNKRILKALEQDEKKRLDMAELDFRLFRKLLVDRDLPALEQDVEYLTAVHDSEIEYLASADEQLFQMSDISLLASQYVTHRLLLKSSDTEYEPGEGEQDDDLDDFSGDGVEATY
ncbi:hypothetical protein AZE42_11010, partial [Rhizopogon vesiculosus]